MSLLKSHLCKPGRPGAGLGVDHVDPVAAQRRQDETVPRTIRVVVAARARVPAAVVKLVTNVAHRQPVDHLQR